MRRPADVVGRVERDADEPRRRQRGDEGATTAEQRLVDAVAAHIDVAVDGDQRDREQRHDAADDAVLSK